MTKSNESLLFFLPSGNCNLGCKYCFQDKIPDPRHSRKTTKDVINTLTEYCRKEKVTHVELFGGEPLLYKDLFRYCVTKLKKTSPSIQIGVATNGTLVDDEILDLFKKYDLSILLSFDGKKETHDKMRGGFDSILAWVMRFNNKSRIGVALQAGQIKGLYKNIKYVWDLDFACGVYVNVIENYGWYKESDILSFEKEYEKAIKGMMKGEGVLTCALQMFDLIQKYKKDNACGICALGLASDWEGNLYPCHRAFELGKEFSIGSLSSGIDEQKNEKIRLEIFNAINSSKSSHQYKVASYCPVSLYQKQRSFNGDWCDEFCRLIEIKAKLVAKYYYEIKDYYQQYSSAIPPQYRQPEIETVL